MQILDLTDYIKPELLILIPVLYFVGLALKKLPKVVDNYIPLILGATGTFLAVLYVLANTPVYTGREILTAIFTGITQGILCAGCSVYANQIVKQLQKPKD